MTEDWKFASPPHEAVVTSEYVINRLKPVLLVCHYPGEDGWAFLTGESLSEEETQLVALKSILEIDPTLQELADLPAGWSAERAGVGCEWRRYEDANDDQEQEMSDEDLFLEDQHPVSRRLAILEDDGTSAWLYLTEPDSRKPAADAWIYNRIAAPPVQAIQSYRGGPPPAAQGYAAETALCEHPTFHEWSFVWSADGESVAVAKNGEPMAFIVAGEKRGYARELTKDGPWGRPWSAPLFHATFDET